MRTFEHVQQQTNYTCGPSCIAIITGETDIDALVVELGTNAKRGTFNKRLVKALQTRDIPCDTRFRSIHNRPLPHTGIIRLKHGDQRIGHVVVKQGTTWFDPEFHQPWTGMPPGRERFWHSGWHMASALWIGDNDEYKNLNSRLRAAVDRLQGPRNRAEP